MASCRLPKMVARRREVLVKCPTWVPGQLIDITFSCEDGAIDGARWDLVASFIDRSLPSVRAMLSNDPERVAKESTHPPH